MNARQQEVKAMSNYRKTEEWKRGGKLFLVTVKHHTERMAEEPAGYDSEGPHRWCIYAYIYPGHPHFAAFDSKGPMYQDAASCLPLHCGPSFFRVHTNFDDGAITSYQVGADYNHYRDQPYTRMANEQEASSVFSDADELFSWLSNP